MVEINVEVKNSTAKKLERIADSQNKSLEEVAAKELEHGVQHHEVRRALTEDCKEGRLDENSSICEHLAKKENGKEFRSKYVV